MDNIGYIKNYEQLKILSDPRRLSILRLLMASSATLSQLGQVLGEHPARVRHHLKQLERAGLIELTETHMVRGFVEKYYRATARAFIFNEIILPQNPVPWQGVHRATGQPRHRPGTSDGTPAEL